MSAVAVIDELASLCSAVVEVPPRAEAAAETVFLPLSAAHTGSAVVVAVVRAHAPQLIRVPYFAILAAFVGHTGPSAEIGSGWAPSRVGHTDTILIPGVGWASDG